MSSIGGPRQHDIGLGVMIMLSIIIVILLPAAESLVGYDCGGEGFNITSLSLLDIGECNMEYLKPKEEEVYVQLMQLTDYDRATVTQCKIEIDRTIYYCGMSSHISAVHNGRREYLQEVGEQGCRRLHETGATRIASATIDRIQRNTTNLRSVTLAGSTTVDGRCSGSQYTDGYGTWENVLVQTVIRITLATINAPIKTSQVILPSGTRCAVSQGYCMDAQGFESYWPPLPIDHCHFDQYNILYEGLATKLSPKKNQTAPVIYTVTTQDTTFALTKTSDVDVCGFRLSQTEHPKLFILETQRGRTFSTKTKIAIENLDIFLYVNSKFIYVEKHIKTQLTQLYRDIMEQKCALERQVLQNALTLASIAPDEMAFRITRETGYTAVTTGEVIHLVKCIPVEVKLRSVDQCYQELPVTHQNKSLFLTPRSRIITRTGTQRDCSDLLPTMYKIHGAWFRLTPKPIEVLAPPTIQPLTKPKWHYVSPASLATSGIYNNDDINRLRSHIMFPVEKPSMLNTLARGALGGSIQPGTVSLSNLLDEDSLNRIVESTGTRLWAGFITFGSASAGVLAVFIIIRVVKLVIDTIIHGYALHSVYGWSMHLLGAIWSSVTHLLLHLGRSPREERTDNDNKPQAPLAPPDASQSKLEQNNHSDKEVSEIHHKSPRYTYQELRQYLDDPRNAKSPV